MKMNFLDLGIRTELTETLKQSGILEPTPIQQKAIPLLMNGKDVIAKSQTGTGKTLAFLLPILESIKINKAYIQALIITPTRELASQITTEAKKLAEPLGINVLSIYGGHGVTVQSKRLQHSPQIVVGTPGRLLDHIKRKNIELSGATKLVLDEADQMLHMGFISDVEEIINQTSGQRQTMLFSATMPTKIRNLAKQYMKKPVDISVQGQNITLDEIKQIVIEVKEDAKLDKLCAMIDEYRPYLAMIFCHTKQRAIKLNTELLGRGYEVDELHGDLSQAKRQRVMKRFSEAKLQILVATDIAARGLDIEGITHVFNYDIPHDVDSYIHRIGRTGRAGEKGLAVTLVDPSEYSYLRLIEQGINATIEKFKINGERIIKRTTPKNTVIKTFSKVEKEYTPKANKSRRSGPKPRSSKNSPKTNSSRKKNKFR